MSQLFIVPTATLEANPPDGTWHAYLCPGDATISLVVIHGWRSEAVRDAWDDLPGTIELHPETWGQAVPGRLAAALAPHGVVPTHTIRQAMRLLRTAWPGARL